MNDKKVRAGELQGKGIKGRGVKIEDGDGLEKRSYVKKSDGDTYSHRNMSSCERLQRECNIIIFSL